MRYLRVAPLLALLLLGLGMGAPALPRAAAQDDSDHLNLYQENPDLVLEWMRRLYRWVQAEGSNAPAAARIYGYASVVFYESLVNGIPGNNSLAGQIWHMPDMPLPDEDEVYDWITVQATAFPLVITALFDDPSEETLDDMQRLQRATLAGRRRVLDEAIVEVSQEYGRDLAAALVAWINEDGYTQAHEQLYTLQEGEGLWELTTDGTQPMEPYWGTLRPLALEHVYDCHVYPTMYYDTEPESPMYQQALEVIYVGRHLTNEQAATARYWVDTPAYTGAPAGHWLAIATQLAEQQGMSIPSAALMYAMLGPALMDAFISAWDLKYQTMVIRPVSYIRQNIRRSWAPYIETPPFPEYPSGHSVVSAAAAEVLTGLFGTTPFSDRTHILYDHEPLERAYTSFWAAANEAAISRLYGGIHFRHGIENGIEQGECIGETVLRYIRLQPLSQGGN